MVKSRKRRIGAYAAVALLLSIPLLASCDSKTAEKYIREAEADRAAGKISAAIIDVKNALQKEPKNIEARVLLARFYLDLPDPASAEAELKRARQDGADAALIAKPLADAELMLGKPQLAMKETEIADTAAPPLKASLLAARGVALMAIGKTIEAQGALEAALEADPHSLDAMAGMARYQLASGDLAAARQSVTEALKLDRKSAILLSLQGQMAFAAGDAAAAEESYQGMLGVAPWSLPARLGIARAQIAENKLKEATATLDVVLKSAPNDPNANYLKALAAYRDSDFAGAQLYIQRARSATKDFPPALLLGGATAYALKQYEQANALLGQYVYLVRNNVPARKLLAATQVAMGQSAEAVKTLSPAVTQGTEDAQLLAMIGEASVRSGDLSSASRYLAQAVEKQPANAALRTQLGATEVALGQTDAGVKELEKAAEQDPAALRPEIALFNAYMHSRDFDKAMEVAQRVQKAHQGDAVGFDLLGFAFLAKGNKDSALQSFAKAREVQPGDSLALQALAALAVKDGDLKLANQYLQEILKANPKDISASIGLAQLEAQQGHLDETQATLEAAVRADPDNPAPRLLLARLFLVGGKNQEVLNALAPALAKTPNEPALLEVAGRAQLALRNTDAAIESFRALVQAQSNSSVAHRYLSETYATAGKLELALSEAQEAVRLDPKSAGAKLGLALIHIAQKNYDEARQTADDLAGQLPQDPNVAELQAKVAMAQNRFEDAIVAYKRELAIADNNLNRAHLSAAQMRAGHLADAEATLVPWIEQHPEDTVSRMALGDIYLAANRLPEAEAQYSAVLAKQPNNAIAENNLAWLLSMRGNAADALKRAQHAAGLAPTSPEVLDTLGVILLQNGKQDEAVDVLRKAIAASLKVDPEYQFHLAQALAGTGKKDEARETLRASLQSDQPFKDKVEAQKLLAELGS